MRAHSFVAIALFLSGCPTPAGVGDAASTDVNTIPDGSVSEEPGPDGAVLDVTDGPAPDVGSENGIDAGPPVLWWESIETTGGCAEGPLDGETFVQGVAAAAPAIGSVAWQELKPCGEMAEDPWYQGSDSSSNRGDIAGITLPGSPPRRLVVVANHMAAGLSPNSFNGLGVFDVDTGDRLFCAEVNWGRHSIGSVMTTSNPPRAIHVYEKQNSASVDAPVVGLGILVLDLETGEMQDHYLPTPGIPWYAGGGFATVTTRGQVVLRWEGGIASIDPETGIPTWAFSSSNDATPARERFCGLWPAEDGAVYASACPSVSDGGYFHIDACGDVTFLPGPRAAIAPYWRPPMLLEDGTATLFEGAFDPVPSLRVERTGGTYIEPRCYHVTALSEGRFACTYRIQRTHPPYYAPSYLSVFNSDGSNRVEIALPLEEEEGYIFEWTVGPPVALAPNHLLLQAYKNGRTRHVAVINIDDVSIEQLFTLQPTPRDLAYWHDQGTTPIVFDNGKIVFSFFGELIVFSSGFAGLENSGYPRGPNHGGNQNRGPIVP